MRGAEVASIHSSREVVCSVIRAERLGTVAGGVAVTVSPLMIKLFIDSSKYIVFKLITPLNKQCATFILVKVGKGYPMVVAAFE